MMNRRSFVTAAAIAPLAACAATPAVAQAVLCAPVGEWEAVWAEYRRIHAAYNAAPPDTADDDYGDIYDKALVRLERIRPETADQFVRKFSALYGEDCYPTDKAIDDLLADARRLSI
ncbi:MAG: hypothetical protein E2598_09975 [Sphingobium sp.]|nr:hypothetical protein [Sphingobium sp.]